MPEVTITILEPDSKEAKALREQVKKDIQDAKDYVDRYGGKSYEGFIETEDGPKGIDDGD